MATTIQFVITGLRRGGAEQMLWKLLSRLDRSRFRPELLALSQDMPMAPDFEAIDVPVRSLGLRAGPAGFLALPRLVAVLRESAPRLVQTWMYHADLLGGLAARRLGLPVVWNIRHSDLAWSRNRLGTLVAARACATLSRSVPQRIVCCAEAALRSHVAIGFDAERMVVIPNGFDSGRLPDPEETRAVQRHAFGLPDGAFVVGLVARYHPQKDHATFVAAAGRFVARRPEAHFVLCGEGADRDNEALRGLIHATGYPEAFSLLGHRKNAAHLVAAFDVAASSSRGEGFSNAIGEAMLAGVPCAVTNAGDSAMLVGDTGLVVPTGDAAALAGAFETLAQRGRAARREMGVRARARIARNYSIESVTACYEALYEEVLLP